MVLIKLNIHVPTESTMDESVLKNENSIRSSNTLQDIAFNIVEEKSNSSQSTGSDSATKERTIFVLGSKGVVIICVFLKIQISK